MVTRRQFLKVGVSGAVLLAAARLGHGGQTRAGGGALDAAAREVLAAIVPVMLAGALPAPGPARASRIEDTIEDIDRTVARLPPHAQAEVRELFALLTFAPARWLIADVRRPWGKASEQEIAAFLQRWRTSAWTLRVQAYHALHELVFAAFYARPDSWQRIGYPGPPRLG